MNRLEKRLAISQMLARKQELDRHREHANYGAWVTDVLELMLNLAMDELTTDEQS